MPLVSSLLCGFSSSLSGAESQKYISCYHLSLHAHHCSFYLFSSSLRKQREKCRKLTFIYLYFYNATDHWKKSNIDMNEIKTKSVPLPHPTPGTTNANNFVNRWLLKVPFNFRIHMLEGKTVERKKGKESKCCGRRISSFSLVFSQRCSRSEMHAFQLSLVVGRDLLLQGYKNVTAPEGDCCLSPLLGVVIN